MLTVPWRWNPIACKVFGPLKSNNCNKGGCGARQWTDFPESTQQGGRATHQLSLGRVLLPNLRQRHPSPHRPLWAEWRPKGPHRVRAIREPPEFRITTRLYLNNGRPAFAQHQSPHASTRLTRDQCGRTLHQSPLRGRRRLKTLANRTTEKEPAPAMAGPTGDPSPPVVRGLDHSAKFLAPASLLYAVSLVLTTARMYSRVKPQLGLRWTDYTLLLANVSPSSPPYQGYLPACLTKFKFVPPFST